MTTEPDLIEEVDALLTKVAPDGKIRDGASAYLFDMRGPELLRRLVERDKRNRDALKMMVELWDAEHPDDPCGCVGASDDCKFPPTCELCVARMVMEGRDPNAD